MKLKLILDYEMEVPLDAEGKIDKDNLEKVLRAIATFNDFYSAGWSWEFTE